MGKTAVQELTARLVAQLKRSGYIRGERVEEAFSKVPRHLFVPHGVTPEEAYRDEVIPLVSGLATLSQPSIVALMLEELEAGPGLRVLEIGTASGYNAALLSRVVGDPALVWTVEIEPRLADWARYNLTAAGFSAVHVLAGDGTLGWAEGAPYARIEVTAEATDLSHHLLAQLDREGILLTPFGVPGLPALLLRLHRQEGGFSGGFVGIPVAFVPLRGEYGTESRSREDGGRRAREAIWAVESEALAQGARPTLDRRLALDLLAAALADGAGLPAPEAAAEAWRRYRAAGRPGLDELGVNVYPLAEYPAPAPAFRRRDYVFCLELPGERNPGGGGESPRREGTP